MSCHPPLQTSKHTLLHYVLNPAPAPYEYAPQSMRHIDTFAPGPGEGAYLPGWELQFQSATHIPGAHRCAARSPVAASTHGMNPS